MKRLLLFAGSLLLAGYLLTGVAEVRPEERAVVRRFGRVCAKPGPGLWIGLPWGMDRVDRVPVDRVRRVEVGYTGEADADGSPPGQLLTGDHNLVNIQVVMVYSVVKDQVENYVIEKDRVDGLVTRAAESALVEWVAGRGVDEVLLKGKAELPGWLVQQTRRRLEPYALGIDIRDETSVSYLYPPEAVRADFDDVNRAQTGMHTRQYKAEQEAEQKIRRAESDRYRERQKALAEANQVRQLARADADSFGKRLEQYQRLQPENPAFLAGIWWDEMGKLFEKLKDAGRIDLLDNHLAGDGLDITVFPPLPGKK